MARNRLWGEAATEIKIDYDYEHEHEQEKKIVASFDDLTDSDSTDLADLRRGLLD